MLEEDLELVAFLRDDLAVADVDGRAERGSSSG